MRQNRIICGTDFSSLAKRTCSLAALWSARGGSTLNLVHVYERGAWNDEKRFPKMEKAVRARLHWEAERLRKLGADVEETFQIGSPSMELTRAASQPGAQCLMVGAVSHQILDRWLLGSVAERSAEDSPIPTIVVRDPIPLERWVKRKRKLNVLVGIDFSSGSDSALQWVRDLESIGTCNITLAHVNWPPETLLQQPSKRPPFRKNSKEVQSVLERDLKEKAQRFLGPKPVEVRVEPGWGRADAHLLTLAKRAKADLIVVGTRSSEAGGRLPFGSVSRSILHHSKVSVAVVPVNANHPATMPLPETRRVLVTTDFSTLGNTAIPHALASVATGGTVKLIHVAPPHELPGALAPHFQKDIVTKELHLQHLKAARIKLRDLIPAKLPRQIKVETEVIHDNDVARAICHSAARWGADMICMASHGRSGLSKAILGSVAQSVLARGHRPVLIIRSPKA